MNNILQRLRTEWRLKIFLTVFLSVWVCLPYYGLQHVRFFPETVMQDGAIDRLVPFAPQAVWLYLSLYLLMPIAPLLMVRREDLLRYAIGMVAAMILATVVFVFWPTVCPRPAAPGNVLAYELLVAIDRPLHAFPSLHACFAVYSVLCANALPPPLRLFLWGWTLLIGYGTLATKQHVFIDLVGGAFLGFLAFWFSQRCRTSLNLNPSTFMKRHAQIVVAACLFALPAIGQDADEPAHAALRQIKAAYEEAIRSDDLSKMAPYVAPNATGVMLTAEEVKGIDGLKAYWGKIKDLMGPGGRYEVTVNPNRSDLFGDTALAHGSTEDIVRIGSGKVYRFSSLWTAVCRKENGQWKVIRMQGTMDPLTNPFVNMRVQFNRIAFGTGGLVLGLLLAMILKRLRKPASKL